MRKGSGKYYSGVFKICGAVFDTDSNLQANNAFLWCAFVFMNRPVFLKPLNSESD